MTRFIVRIIAVIAMCAITSCEMLVDLGILPSKSLQTSHLEMLVTAEEYGYNRMMFSTEVLRDHRLRDGRFAIVYNHNRNDGTTFFSLSRYRINPKEGTNLNNASIYFNLYLPDDIPFEVGTKYYFGNLEGKFTDDGVVASATSEDGWYGSRISFYPLYNAATSGWMKFNRFEPYGNNDGEYIIDMEFEFEIVDPESHEVVLVAEKGKIFDNPGKMSDDSAMPGFINPRVRDVYTDVVYFSLLLEDADEFAYLCVPMSEYRHDMSAEEIFERGAVLNLDSYNTKNEYPIKIAETVSGLTPDMEYTLCMAAKNYRTGLYSRHFCSFKTPAPGDKVSESDIYSLDVVSVTENTATLEALVWSADTLAYHICEGEQCDCDYDGIEFNLTPIEFDYVYSYGNYTTVTFELSNLSPATTYTILLEAANRVSSATISTTFTTL